MSDTIQQLLREKGYQFRDKTAQGLTKVVKMIQSTTHVFDMDAVDRTCSSLSKSGGRVKPLKVLIDIGLIRRTKRLDSGIQYKYIGSHKPMNIEKPTDPPYHPKDNPNPILHGVTGAPTMRELMAFIKTNPYNSKYR